MPSKFEYSSLSIRFIVEVFLQVSNFCHSLERKQERESKVLYKYSVVYDQNNMVYDQNNEKVIAMFTEEKIKATYLLPPQYVRKIFFV